MINMSPSSEERPSVWEVKEHSPPVGRKLSKGIAEVAEGNVRRKTLHMAHPGKCVHGCIEVAEVAWVLQNGAHRSGLSTYLRRAHYFPSPLFHARCGG